MLAAGGWCAPQHVAGTQDEKAADIKLARAAAEKMNRPLAILADLAGPKIRTRTLKNHQPVEIKTNQEFIITTREIEGDATQVATNYDGMPQDVHAGARILLDDGAIELLVESTTETDVITRVINGGILGERKGINLPGVSLPIPSMTEKDRDDLRWLGRITGGRLLRALFRAQRQRLPRGKRLNQRRRQHGAADCENREG
jgi:pyruvate kinase